MLTGIVSVEWFSIVVSTSRTPSRSRYVISKRMRKRELRHVVGIAPELEAACHLGALVVGADVRHFPLGCVRDQPMDRLLRAVAAIVVQRAGLGCSASRWHKKPS